MAEEPGHPGEVAASSEATEAIRRLPVFIIIAFALLMMSIDATIVATALDALQRGLDTSINWAGWTLTAYSFGFVVMLPISGKMSERYGRRRIFLLSVVVFTLASLLCGLANNIYLLIALRALQAAGGAGFTPSATGIIVDYFGDARDRAVSLFGSIFPVGAMIGPILGGFFVSYWTWRAVFFVNVPIGLAVILLALHYIPHDKVLAPVKRQPMDFPSMLLLGGTLLAFMLAASYLGEARSRLSSPFFLLPFGLAVLSTFLFFRRIRRAKSAFIEPHLIYGEGFGAVNFINATIGGISLGAVALIPVYAANRYGMDAFSSGTLLIAQGIAATVFSTVMALSLRKTGHRVPIFIGALIVALGLLLLALSPLVAVSPYVWLAGAAFLVGAGFGATNPPSRNAGLQLEPEHSSTLAALRSMFLQIGSIATISVATAVFAGTQRSGGNADGLVYIGAALLLLLCLPAVSRIPEHYGSW